MRLYVGNLAYSVTSQSLEQLFSEFGQVKDATVVQDRDTGRSKGFGFVEMSTDAEAQAAIAAIVKGEFRPITAEDIANEPDAPAEETPTDEAKAQPEASDANA
jgi:hypothetical protein